MCIIMNKGSSAPSFPCSFCNNEVVGDLAAIIHLIIIPLLAGLCASTVSDCCSNSIRVIKTTKQTAEREITYTEAVRQIVEKDGWKGLFGRGLQTRLLTNGLQGALFAVVWKGIEQMYFSPR